jgi:SAM-dependent methyltransferase
MKTVQVCGLCNSTSVVEFFTHPRWGTYFHCTHCDFRFLDSAHYVDVLEEEKIYKQHTNELDNPYYIEFLNPTVDLIKQHVSQQAAGLDYGCGYSPLLATWLNKDGYRVDTYDPMFFPDKSQLATSYDYIIATEVIEHFKDPTTDFELLSQLLKPGAKFIAMTLLYDKSIVFDNWHYRRDPTHVSFFSIQSLDFLAEKMHWDILYSDKKRTFVFQKKI